MGIEVAVGRCDGVDGSAENVFGWDFKDKMVFRFAWVLESANLSSNPCSTTNRLIDIGQGNVSESVSSSAK